MQFDVINNLLLFIISIQLALKASQLLEQTKLSELRSSIARSLSELEMFTEDGENMDTPKRKSAINERMENLVSAPLAVEDALVGLLDHSDHTLQRRVVETYVRRLYQVIQLKLPRCTANSSVFPADYYMPSAISYFKEVNRKIWSCNVCVCQQPYLVKGSVRMQWHRSGLIASWEFLEEHVEKKNESQDHTSDKPLVEKHSERKWGAMVIIKSLQLFPAIVSAALRETTHNLDKCIPNGSGEPDSYGNMMHVALVGISNQMSLLQDRYSGCLCFAICNKIYYH